LGLLNSQESNSLQAAKRSSHLQAIWPVERRPQSALQDVQVEDQQIGSSLDRSFELKSPPAVPKDALPDIRTGHAIASMFGPDSPTVRRVKLTLQQIGDAAHRLNQFHSEPPRHFTGIRETKEAESQLCMARDALERLLRYQSDGASDSERKAKLQRPGDKLFISCSVIETTLQVVMIAIDSDDIKMRTTEKVEKGLRWYQDLMVALANLKLALTGLIEEVKNDSSLTTESFDREALEGGGLAIHTSPPALHRFPRPTSATRTRSTSASPLPTSSRSSLRRSGAHDRVIVHHYHYPDDPPVTDYDSRIRDRGHSIIERERTRAAAEEWGKAPEEGTTTDVGVGIGAGTRRHLRDKRYHILPSRDSVKPDREDQEYAARKFSRETARRQKATAGVEALRRRQEDLDRDGFVSREIARRQRAEAEAIRHRQEELEAAENRQLDLEAERARDSRHFGLRQTPRTDFPYTDSFVDGESSAWNRHTSPPAPPRLPKPAPATDTRYTARIASPIYTRYTARIPSPISSYNRDGPHSIRERGRDIIEREREIEERERTRVAAEDLQNALEEISIADLGVGPSQRWEPVFEDRVRRREYPDASGGPARQEARRRR
jgi:hypothetical protein